MPSRRRFIQTNIVGLGLSFAGRAAPPAAFLLTTETIPPREENERDYWNDWPRYLSAKMDEARSRRLAELSAMQTEVAVRARIEKIQSTVWKLIGGPFEKTPLKSQIIGTIDRGAYRIERSFSKAVPRSSLQPIFISPTTIDRRIQELFIRPAMPRMARQAIPINTYRKPWPEKGTWFCHSIPSAKVIGCSISTCAPGRVPTGQPVNTIKRVGRCCCPDRSLRSIESGMASEPSIICSLARRSTPSE